MSYLVSIGSYIVLTKLPVSYTRTRGTQPSSLALRLPASSVAEIVENAGRDNPYTLSVTTPDGRRFESGPWYYYAKQATEVPQVGVVVFKDRRMWWNNRALNRSYNLRRRVGFERAIPADNEGNYATQQVVPDVTWRQRTIRNGTPWKPLEMLLDVLASVEPDAEIKVNSTATRVPNPEIDDIVISGYGGDCVDQALRNLPELDVTVDPDGSVVVYSRAAGLAEDERLARQLEPNILGSAQLTIQDLAARCPTEIHLLFQVEAEVRVDAFEGEDNRGSVVGGSVQPEPTVTEPDRLMTNVAEVADFEITIGDNTVVQGTYANWEDYLAALPNGPSGEELTKTQFQAAAIPYSSFPNAWADMGKVGEEKDNWPARVQALQSSFRKLYRLPRGWVDGAISIRPSRVSTVDQESGARARALVFGDHFVIPSTKARVRQAESGSVFVELGRNVAGWTETIDSETIPSIALVNVEDEDQGIIRLNYVLDPWGESAQILPSQIDTNRIPVLGSRRDRQNGNINRPVCFNSFDGTGEENLPRLSDDHAVAVVLTMMPVPDTEARMYRVKVRPQDVRDRLPLEVRRIVDRARGQIQEIIIPPGNDQTARVAWNEEAKDRIERLFLAPESIRPEDLQPFVINDGPSQGAGGNRAAAPGPSLRSISEAVAVRRWATYAPHLSGQMTSGVEDGWDLRLRGYAESVTSSLSETGARHTISYAEQLPLYDWSTVLDPGTRALLFRQVMRGGTQ